MRIYTIAPLLLAGLVFAGGISPPAHATHNSEFHCPQDPNADRYVDIFDLSIFAGAFNADPAPAHLDIVPALVGDGVISVTGELATVAGDFGESCIGNTELHPDPPQTESFGPYVNGCRSVTAGSHTQVEAGWIGVTNWGGLAFCYTGSGFTYRFQCTFEWLALIGGRWQLVAVSEPGQTYGPRQYGGQYCGAPGGDTAIPCGYLIMGHANMNVTYNNVTLFNSFQPEDGFGFQAC